MTTDAQSSSSTQAASAWLKRAVNVGTAFGGALSLLAVLYAFRGYPRVAWMLMGAGLIIDSLDGLVVRSFDLTEAVDRYDGARLDEYADLITYVVAPVSFAWAVEMLPFNVWGLGTGAVVCAVSCLQFSRVDNKTDRAFWGFPSFWNVIYFYGWALHASPPVMIAVSLVLSAAVFAPIPFIYPSRFDRAFLVGTVILMHLWLGVLLATLVWPDLAQAWIWGSMAFPALYVIVSALKHGDIKQK
jgi:phosphatidylcholine synthase